MNLPSARVRLVLPSLAGLAVLALAACSSSRTGNNGAPAMSPEFAAAKVVLETNCVHCHGRDRLTGMPPIETTRQLARLIGPGNWIVPGRPDLSRFYQVTIFPDEIPNAMPPTGHGISAPEKKALHDWILAGAPLPKKSVRMHPVGEPPRSR